MSAPKAILFDLDGTLTDRPASLREAARRLVAAFPELGKRRFEQVSEALILADDNGMRPRLDMMARWVAALEWIDPPPQDELLRWWSEHFGACTVAAPGLPEVLAACAERELALGLVTNGGGRAQRQKLEKLGIAGR
ncbi:MAG TPA: haloacid dehalogenase-like hydrolase, partial [Limnochordia bacterium]|nr:haloacid dehalogenase-like hydrolase [Limnochordia bacterium]